MSAIFAAPKVPEVYRARRVRHEILDTFTLEEDILYHQEVERWRERLDLDVYVTVDRVSNGRPGNVGVSRNSSSAHHAIGEKPQHLHADLGPCAGQC